MRKDSVNDRSMVFSLYFFFPLLIPFENIKTVKNIQTFNMFILTNNRSAMEDLFSKFTALNSVVI